MPLVAGLGYGLYATLSPAAAGILHRAQRPHRVAPTPFAQSRSQVLGVRYSGPPGWTVVDYTTGPNPEPALVLTRDAADQAAAAAAVGDLAQVDQPRSSVIAVARRPLDVTPVADPGDPVAALTSEVAPLVGTPPAGVRVEVVRPVHAVTIGGRPAAEVELKLERDSGVAYLRRDVVYAPHDQAPQMCQVDALVPEAEWPAAETGTVSKEVGSLSFG